MARGARIIPRAPVMKMAAITSVERERKEAKPVMDSPGRYLVILQLSGDVEYWGEERPLSLIYIKFLVLKRRVVGLVVGRIIPTNMDYLTYLKLLKTCTNTFFVNLQIVNWFLFSSISKLHQGTR